MQIKQQAQSEATTFKFCVAEFYKHKSGIDWQSHAQALGRSLIRNYLDPVPFADLPVRDINAAHIETILKPIWRKSPVMAKRTAHFLSGMFKWRTWYWRRLSAW